MPTPKAELSPRFAANHRDGASRKLALSIPEFLAAVPSATKLYEELKAGRGL